MTDIAPKCTVRNGKFVDPCVTLNSMVQNIAPGFSKATGIARWTYTNTQTREPSRTFFGIKTKDHPNGMLFNVCPWCGERIDAPFVGADDEEPQVTTPAIDRTSRAYAAKHLEGGE